VTQAYATATAFRTALEARLMNMARDEAVDVQRLRRQVSFDRLLCRLFYRPDAPWMLKGGYAMELRIEEGRATKDVDLALRSPLHGSGKLTARILIALQDAAAVDLGDFFVYAIGAPMQDLDGAPDGGARYPVETRMNGRTFARFHVDVGAGDIVVEPTEEIEGRDWLDFAGIPARPFPAISKEQQFAEKVHAYTLRRDGRNNTRVRDLVDMFLLVRLGLDNAATQKALVATFDRRGLQPLEENLPPPSNDWIDPFAALAEECGIVENCAKAFAGIAKFYDALNIRAAK
jgi:hypothetical protein